MNFKDRALEVAKKEGEGWDWTSEQVRSAAWEFNKVMKELYREGFRDALVKVANDWQEKGFRSHDEIMSVEVQAFLDTRIVHYPEAQPMKDGERHDE